MPLRVLELFCGTKSIGKWCAKSERVNEVVSLDIDPKCDPTHLGDILTWDFKMYPPGHFDIIWSSPPCTHYSVLRTTGGPRDLEGANAIVQRTLAIIEYFNPKVWFMENPATGLLKKQPFMTTLPYIDVHYCKYGYAYRKWTRIWTNLSGVVPRLCNMDCDAMIPDPLTGRMRHKGTFGGSFSRVPLRQRYSVPPTLVNQLMSAACNQATNSSELIIEAEHIETMPGGGKRIPVRLRATHIDNESVTEEYNSLSEAAKALEGQCAHRNIRAALSRCLMKNEAFAGRKWQMLSPQPNPDAGDRHFDNIVELKTQETSLSVRLAEMELQKQQAVVKSKQLDLLTSFVNNRCNVDDSVVQLIKHLLQ